MQRNGISVLSSRIKCKKMHRNFVAQHSPERKNVSYQYYKSILKERKIKFHRAKKYLCSTCFNARKTGTDADEVFRKHIEEKEAVRIIMQQAVNDSNNCNAYAAIVFDLQQVMYVPMSNLDEAFYKWRLACYNFTTYDMANQSGTCFFWHEGTAKRGSREISSCLYKFLGTLDEKGVEHVQLFSDSCVGQNKNSIAISSFFNFLEHSKEIKPSTSISLSLVMDKTVETQWILHVKEK
jgi:hypothetical protein